MLWRDSQGVPKSCPNLQNRSDMFFLHKVLNCFGRENMAIGSKGKNRFGTLLEGELPILLGNTYLDDLRCKLFDLFGISMRRQYFRVANQAIYVKTDSTGGDYSFVYVER